MIRKAILPAAGLGTRFLPATKASPKEMLPIVDKPMIQYSVEEADSCGISEFIIITGKNKRAIEDHFDSAFELEENLRQKGDNRLIDEITKHRSLRFAYIRQGRPIGLGNAILCAQPFANKESFAVLLGDDIIDPDDKLLSDMIKIYDKYNAPVIALKEIPSKDVSRYGVIDGVKIDEHLYRIKNLVEKPSVAETPSNLAILGRYILTPDIFEILKEMPPGRNGEYQLTDALNVLAKRRDVYGFLFKGRHYDAGDKFGFLQATISLALKRPEFSEQLKAYITNLSQTF